MNGSHDPVHSPPAGAPTSDERTLALLAHLLPFVTSFVGPLVVWLLKKDESRFVGDHAKEALNFLITVTLAQLLCLPLFCILIGYFAFLGISITAVVFLVVAAVAANGGRPYRYPLTLRLVQ